MLEEYLKGFWKRLAPRLELMNAPEKQEQLERKICKMCFGIALLLANQRKKDSIDDEISRETIVMVDSVILNSMQNLILSQ